MKQLKQKATPAAYGEIWERLGEIREQMFEEFASGNHPHQPWKLVPAGRVKKIWADMTASGVVRDTKGLRAILDRMIENAMRLFVNNIVAGHEALPPLDALDGIWDEETPDIDRKLEEFCNWAIDIPTTGGWRISDYGLPKIIDALALAVGTNTAEERLVYIDMALNVIHMRSDLASWFVEGGRATLSEISGEKGVCFEG